MSPADTPAGSRLPGDAVTARIARWHPVSVPPEAADFARAVVTAASPGTPDRAKNLLHAAAKAADFAAGLGLDLVPEVVLHPSVIERFATCAPGLPASARRTLRTNLRFLARELVPALDPAAAPLPRERSRAPYSPAQIAGYLALAGAQPAPGRRAKAAGLICLGAGAGLTGADLRQVTGADVARRSGGVIVEVRGRRPRTVPVLPRYHEILLASAGFAGSRPVTGGRDPARRNVTTPLISSLAGGAGLPRLDTGRLRVTWLADCADRIGLATFMAAAGITCSQRLGDLIAALDPADEAGAVRLLGTAR
jgi:integrase